MIESQHTRITDLIDLSPTSIGELNAINFEDREKIEGYLKEVKLEALSPSPSWSKIFGALVIVATIVGGFGEGENAAKNARDSIANILGTSVRQPREGRLPAANVDDFAKPGTEALVVIPTLASGRSLPDGDQQHVARHSIWLRTESRFQASAIR
jgi:hypothetical protein